MKRRTLVKVFSLFAVTSIFSASASIVGDGRVDATQCSRVKPNFSSCARKIDAVFRHYKLHVNSFDIKYRARNGKCYEYAKRSNKSMEKLDEWPSFLLSPISLRTHPNLDDPERIIAQGQFLSNEVYSSIQDVMTEEGVTSLSVQFDTTDSNGQPCTYNPGGLPGPQLYGPH